MNRMCCDCMCLVCCICSCCTTNSCSFSSCCTRGCKTTAYIKLSKPQLPYLLSHSYLHQPPCLPLKMSFPWSLNRHHKFRVPMLHKFLNQPAPYAVHILDMMIFSKLVFLSRHCHSQCTFRAYTYRVYHLSALVHYDRSLLKFSKPVLHFVNQAPVLPKFYIKQSPIFRTELRPAAHFWIFALQPSTVR